MKVVVFANESYFSYLLAHDFFSRHHYKVVCLILTSAHSVVKNRYKNIFLKSHFRYFLYRSMVQFISYYRAFVKRQSLYCLAKKYSIPIFRVKPKEEMPVLLKQRALEIGIALNYVQILDKNVLNNFPYGVINVHASRLPRDKGISPVLWAFARGDPSIFSTIYKMDGGLDTGPIYQQIEIPVRKSDTAFSLYERVCKNSSVVLAQIFDALMDGYVRLSPQDSHDKGNVFSWPDSTHFKMMLKNKKKLINFSDVRRGFFGGYR